MMKLLSLAAMALPMASGLNIMLYSDAACTGVPTPLIAYNGVCTSTLLYRMVGATCSSDTSAQVSVFNSNTACSGATAFSGQVTITCTPLAGVTGYGSAKIVNGTCTTGGAPVYNAALYTDAACTTANQMGPLGFPIVVDGKCNYYGWQGSLATTTVVGSGINNISMTVASTATSCDMAYYRASMSTTACTDLTAAFGSTASIKLAPAAAYTSGAATVVASLAAVVMAVFVAMASAL